MSAWIVDKAHIDYLVSAGFIGGVANPLEWFDAEPGPEAFREGEPWGPGWREHLEEHGRKLTRETAGRVGAMLWAENVASVNHRYAETELEDPYLFARVMVEGWAALKALECYEYQSCEHPGWRTSEARAFCDALRARLIDHLEAQEPRYTDAPWGFTADTVRYIGEVRTG